MICKIFNRLLIVFLAYLTFFEGVAATTERAGSIAVKEKSSQTTQLKTITGKITETSGGEGLPGVNVLVKGTSTGIISDAEGNYKIQVTKEEDILIFSFTGFLSKEVVVGKQTNINIALTRDIQDLDEIVVVGYGTQKKVNLTGSIAVIDQKALEGRPITNASQALQGVPGLYVNQVGGQPGGDAASIRLRGVGTIGGSAKLNPLVLVDGIEYPIGDVNPSDIKSISVLKDAASTAIYGSRAANGVILITTKMGQEGKLAINYSSYYGVQEVTYLPDPVDNSAVFMEWYNKAKVNEGSAPYYAESLINEFKTNPTSLEFPNTNWLDVMFKPAAMQEHDLRFSGGTEKIKYNLGIRYLDQDGVLMGTAAKVYGANLKVNSQVTKRLSLEGAITISSRNSEEPADGAGYVMNRTMRLVPMMPSGRFENGSYADTWVATPGQNVFENQVVRARNTYRNLANNRLLASATLNYNILDNLIYRLQTSVNHRYSLTKQWKPEFTDVINPRTNEIGRPTFPTSQKSHAQNEDQRLYLANTLTYDTRFADKHSLSALLGNSVERYKEQDFSASAEGFPNMDLDELSLGTLNPQVSGSSVEDNLMSYFGRVQYSFMDRYLFEVNGRFDGSSRIAKQNRWGFFPSFSLGWRISEESFIRNIKWLNELKVRASWGQIGNQEIGRFQYVPAVGLGYNYPFGGTWSSGAAVTQSRDANLKWETTTMTNIGLDWQLFDGKLDGTVDVFKKRTDGILRTVNLPGQVGGLTGPVTNVAVVDNSGIELGINHRNNIGKSFTYEIGAHITTNKNEVIDLKGETIIGNHRITQKGSPVDSWYIYKTDGLFQTQEEVDNYPTITSRVKPGDVKYVDLNGDDKIDGNDRYIAGRTYPKYTYGFNLGFGYKGVRLQTMWQGVWDISIYPDHNMVSPFNNGAGLTKNWTTDSWTPENPNAPLPRISTRNGYSAENFSISDFWLRDASYLRLKNIQISYPFTGNILTRIGVKRLEIYANAQNILTFSPLDFWDPETDILINTSTSSNSTLSQYPSVRTFTMGLKLDF